MEGLIIVSLGHTESIYSAGYFDHNMYRLRFDDETVSEISLGLEPLKIADTSNQYIRFKFFEVSE